MGGVIIKHGSGNLTATVTCFSVFRNERARWISALGQNISNKCQDRTSRFHRAPIAPPRGRLPTLPTFGSVLRHFMPLSRSV